MKRRHTTANARCNPKGARTLESQPSARSAGGELWLLVVELAKYSPAEGLSLRSTQASVERARVIAQCVALRLLSHLHPSPPRINRDHHRLPAVHLRDGLDGRRTYREQKSSSPHIV